LDGLLANGIIDLTALPSSETPQTKQTSPTQEPIAIKLHAILTALNSKIEGLEVILNKQRSLTISKLETRLEGEQKGGYPALQQNISLDINIEDDHKNLSLNGLFSSARSSNRTNARVELSAIDLSEFVPATSSDDMAMKSKTNSAPETVSQPEAAIDWSWLKSVEGLDLELSAPKIALHQNMLEEIALHLSFDNEISLRQLQAKIDWRLSQEMQFVDSLDLSGTITPLSSETIGADVELDIALKTPKFESLSKGRLNLNGVSKQDFSVNLSLHELPIVESGDSNVFSNVLQQYIPIQLNSSVMSETEKVTLGIAKSSFGNTTFSAKLVADKIAQDIPKLSIAFSADKLSFQSKKSTTTEDQSKVEELAKKEDSQLFSDDPLDWSFMRAADIDAQIEIKELLLNKLIVDNIQLTGVLNDNSSQAPANSRQLLVKDVSATVAEGEISGSLEVLNIDESAKIKLNLDVNELALESLSIMPQEQLSGGNITIDTDLELAGNSLSALASSTNGQLYVDLNEAIIQNDSFELIGSDLIFELINKLNPFAKNDPTTKLKCATVYIPIKQGIAELDDSIALQTSKLVIVANGKIDLDKEKLDLKFTPTSKSGIGVNVSSMVKFIKLGGTLSKPSPAFDAGGALASGLAAGAALSTGGTSLLATGLLDKAGKNNVCGHAKELYLNQ